VPIDTFTANQETGDLVNTPETGMVSSQVLGLRHVIMVFSYLVTNTAAFTMSSVGIFRLILSHSISRHA
jgi:hypothetical protein